MVTLCLTCTHAQVNKHAAVKWPVDAWLSTQTIILDYSELLMNHHITIILNYSKLLMSHHMTTLLIIIPEDTFYSPKGKGVGMG